MIAFSFSPLSLFFLPIETIRVDLIALAYDLLLACITGYVVWYKTDEYIQRRDERQQFTREQQEYSRYLGRINIKIRAYKRPDKLTRLEIEDLLENAPVREVFVFPDSPERDSFDTLDVCFAQIQGCLNKDSHCQPELLRISRDISKCRLGILSLQIKQPPTKVWKLWGKPSLAAPRQ